MAAGFFFCFRCRLLETVEEGCAACVSRVADASAAGPFALMPERRATAQRARASEVRSSRIASIYSAAAWLATFRTVVSNPAAEWDARAAALQASRHEEIFAICVSNHGCQGDCYDSCLIKMAPWAKMA
mmetsp:Transcript_69899/g.138366  ORF Transcript_69899/g.138366 Transcript_69899/m.138366 type:complete len:129 (-) Transcript_69899:6-392(-)